MRAYRQVSVLAVVSACIRNEKPRGFQFPQERGSVSLRRIRRDVKFAADRLRDSFDAPPLRGRVPNCGAGTVRRKHRPLPQVDQNHPIGVHGGFDVRRHMKPQLRGSRLLRCLANVTRMKKSDHVRCLLQPAEISL